MNLSAGDRNPAPAASTARPVIFRWRGLKIKRQHTSDRTSWEREETVDCIPDLTSSGKPGFLKASRYAIALLALLAALFLLSAACGNIQSVQETEPAPPQPTPFETSVPASPTPTARADRRQEQVLNVPATVSAVLTRVAPTPQPTVDVSATVAAELTRVAPTPTQEPRRPATTIQGFSISDLVEEIEDGLVQILTPTASGSGFAVSDDGLIITNAHLVEDHAFVSVRSVKGYSYAGLVQGKDEDLDLAVVKVHSLGNIKAIPLGESAEVRPGDPVFAMGFPLGEQLGDGYTITTGIVSSLRTSGSVARIQTDAAINVGSSGGPLLNSAGEVIGVNTATFREYVGISLAISIQEVKDNLRALTAGQSALARAGVELQDYYNQECQYSVQAPSGWQDIGEGAGCRIFLAKYEGDVQVGAIQVWDYDLRQSETLDGFSAWWEAEMEQRANDWHNFTHIYSGKASVERDGIQQEQYAIQYSWQETEEHCVSFATDTIVLNHELRRALIFSASVCQFVPAPEFHAAASATITVAGPARASQRN